MVNSFNGLAYYLTFLISVVFLKNFQYLIVLFLVVCKDSSEIPLASPKKISSLNGLALLGFGLLIRIRMSCFVQTCHQIITVYLLNLVYRQNQKCIFAFRSLHICRWRASGVAFLSGSKYLSFSSLADFLSVRLERIGWDIDLVVVLLNGLATLTESELKTALKLTEPEKFLLNLDWKFT